MVEKLHPFTTELPELRHDKTFLPAWLAGALPVRGPSAFLSVFSQIIPSRTSFIANFQSISWQKCNCRILLPIHYCSKIHPIAAAPNRNQRKGIKPLQQMNIFLTTNNLPIPFLSFYFFCFPAKQKTIVSRLLLQNHDWRRCHSSSIQYQGKNIQGNLGIKIHFHAWLQSGQSRQKKMKNRPKMRKEDLMIT